MLLDLGDMPLAGGFLIDLADAPFEQSYPLVIHGCRQCGLVQIVDPIDPSLLFGDYAFSSSTVRPLVTHFEGYADWLATTFHPARVLEFGCNDGILLQPLGKCGIDAVGIDISGNITEIARAKGLNVYTGKFELPWAQQHSNELGSFDVITSSNTFAHNQDPGSVLKAAKLLLAPDGVLCLEFMYAGDLAELTQWDTLYHEHLTFYSLGTLETLFARFGLKVFHAERLPMHGGSLRIAASVSDRTPDDLYESVARYESESGLNEFVSWSDFGARSRRAIDVTAQVLSDLSVGNEIWAYGAAGKATMWLNACDMGYLKGIVDASPLRAGRFMPGTHTPIVTPEQFKNANADYVFVSAWNYLDVIRQQEPQFDGPWITPLPELRFQ